MSVAVTITLISGCSSGSDEEEDNTPTRDASTLGNLPDGGRDAYQPFDARPERDANSNKDGSADGSGHCSPECSQGDTRCSGGMIQKCDTTLACAAFGTAAQCAGGAACISPTLCAPPPGCSVTAACSLGVDFCGTNNRIHSCVPDSSGCPSEGPANDTCCGASACTPGTRCVAGGGSARMETCAANGCASTQGQTCPFGCDGNSCAADPCPGDHCSGSGIQCDGNTPFRCDAETCKIPLAPCASNQRCDASPSGSGTGCVANTTDICEGKPSCLSPDSISCVAGVPQKCVQSPTSNRLCLVTQPACSGSSVCRDGRGCIDPCPGSASCSGSAKRCQGAQPQQCNNGCFANNGSSCGTAGCNATTGTCNGAPTCSCSGKRCHFDNDGCGNTCERASGSTCTCPADPVAYIGVGCTSQSQCCTGTHCCTPGDPGCGSLWSGLNACCLDVSQPASNTSQCCSGFRDGTGRCAPRPAGNYARNSHSGVMCGDFMQTDPNVSSVTCQGGDSCCGGQACGRTCGAGPSNFACDEPADCSSLVNGTCCITSTQSLGTTRSSGQCEQRTNCASAAANNAALSKAPACINDGQCPSGAVCCKLQTGYPFTGRCQLQCN